MQFLGWNVLQPTNLALEGAHLTLEFNQDGEKLAKKHEQVMKMTKLMVEKIRKCYKREIHNKKCEVEYEVGEKNVGKSKQIYYIRRPHSKVHVQGWTYVSH